jgi:hypothetical protein
VNQIYAANKAHVEELEALGRSVLAELAREIYADQMDLL